MGLVMSFVPTTILTAEDLAARDTFVAHVAHAGVAYIVDGRDGIATVPSARHPGRHVELLWSDRAEAVRWAPVLAADSQVRAVELAVLLATHLPAVAAAGRVAGPNWSDVPAEPEMAADELGRLIRRALAAEFAEIAHATRQVWLLNDGGRFATLETNAKSPAVTLPVFSSRDTAAAAAAMSFPNAVPVRQPLADFLSKTLMGAIEVRWRLAPAYMPGADVLELAPWDMKALLHGTPQPRRVA